MYEYTALVRRVYDGDTITVDIDIGFGIWMHDQKIRLADINTPEIRGAEKVEGLKARDWLRNRILNKVVMLHTIKDKKGKYGRWLGRIYLPDSVLCVNYEMVELGLAKMYGEV